MRTWAVALVLASMGAGQAAAGDGTGLDGTRVRVETAASGRLVGVVIASDASFLTIQGSPEADATRVARSDIRGLEVSRGKRRHTVHGLIGGAVAWAAVVGLVAAFDTLDESGVGEPLFVAGMVGTGALVGTLIKTERWERVPTPALSLGVSPHGRGVRVQVALRF